MYLSTLCHTNFIGGLKFSVFLTSVNTYGGKVVCRIFRNSSYVTHDMRMLLGPSYFAQGHIDVGVSACLLCRQIEDCWP